MSFFDLKKIVVVDAETYWATDFSLTNKEHNTSSYIRDPQFKEHCWAIKAGTKKTRGFKAADGIKFLQDIDWSTHALCAHNTAFDGFILAEHHGIIPSFYIDTLSMTRGLHNEVSRAKLEKIAVFYNIGEKSKTYLAPTKGLRDLSPAIFKGLLEGCVLDTDLCYEVMTKQLEIYPEHELRLIDLTLRMFCNPVMEVDEPLAERALAEEMIERRATILRAKVDEKDLMSNPKFAALLVKLGVEPPTKISNRTGLENYAFAQTDPEFIELQEHEDVRVVRLTQARLAAKSTQAETRAARLLQAGKGGMKLPVLLNYFGAKTGRWSGGNKLNMQNLPRVNPYEPKPSDGLRRSIIAPAGHQIVVADSAQIEARIAAWVAGQDDIVALFANGEDVYSYAATRIYGRTITSKNKDERFVGKVATLGLQYGMGGKKFQTTLALGMMGPAVIISLAEANKVVKIYRGSNAKIALAWKILNNVIENMAAGRSGEIFDGLIEYDPITIWLPNGMGLHYPGLHRTESGDFRYKANETWKKIYGGLLFENIVQALARIAVGEQMLLTDEYLKTLKLKKNEVARITTMSHDEIVSVVPDRYAQKVLDNKLKIMRTPPHNWGENMPFNAEGGFARNYSK
jgi:DNA polymerase